jgi:hypothetical protein
VSTVSAADSATRTAVALGDPQPCAAPVSVVMLGQTYYRQADAALSETVTQLLDACSLSAAIKTRYAILLFTAKPTPDGKAAVVHILYDATERAVRSQPALLGVDAATWIYFSDDKNDRAVVQLSSLEVQNPILGQLGKLASTIVPKLPAAASLRPRGVVQTYPIYGSVSPATPLPFRRATITESDFVAENKTQIDGSATFSNQPRTWLTVNAGAGGFVGKTTGPTPVTIDNKAYVSDPLARGATFAGVTFHAPYDAGATKPSRAEHFGVGVAAVLTPALGIFVGPSYGWRGLAVMAGWAEMLVDVPPAPKQVNDAVEDHERLATGRVGRALVAVSYAFGS